LWLGCSEFVPEKCGAEGQRDACCDKSSHGQLSAYVAKERMHLREGGAVTKINGIRRWGLAGGSYEALRAAGRLLRGEAVPLLAELEAR
jgi:hypothetical protein